jgi:hypothetical protein
MSTSKGKTYQKFTYLQKKKNKELAKGMKTAKFSRQNTLKK